MMSTTPEKAKLSVLVADDSDDVRAVIMLTLRARGYEVVGVVDGKEADRELRQREFDVVLSDVIMPEADGFALIHSVRSCQPNARVILMSGGGFYDNADDKLGMAGKLGASAVIRKPFTPSQLVQVIVAAVANRTP